MLVLHRSYDSTIAKLLVQTLFAGFLHSCNGTRMSDSNMIKLILAYLPLSHTGFKESHSEISLDRIVHSLKLRVWYTV